jgi:hypothetical protein
MKKLLLLLIVAIASTSNYVAQTVPNGGFENWNTASYDNPTPWNNSNQECLGRNLPVNVTKVAGFSGFGVRLETVANTTDTSFAYIANFPNEPNGEGGVPFSQIPTSITGYFRYDLGTTDSAIMIVFFKKNGVVISEDLIQFRGATGVQSTWASFSFPLTSFTTVPDSVVFAAASSNAMSGVGVQVGSFLELDNVGFAGPGVTQTLSGGTFETWTMESVISLNDWNISGDQGFSRVSPGRTGNYAVQLVTQDYGPEGIWGAGVSMGDNSQSGPIGGMPISSYVDTLCGYYKYSTNVGGFDSARFMYHGLWFGVMQTGQDFRMGPAANWTYFEFPLNPWLAPIDTLNFSFSSSNEWPVNNAFPGSTLVLDDIHLKSQLVGLKNHNPFDMVISTYPNPTTDVLNLKWNKKFNENVVMNVYSISGQLISSEVIEKGNNSKQLNIKEYTDGAYLITIASSSKTWKTTFIKK